MFIENLKSGARVQIQGRGEDPTGGYMCKVEVLIPEKKEVLIHAPVERGRLVRMRVGSDFTLRLLSDNATYMYKAKLVEYTDVDGFDVVRFRLEGDGEKVQRRSSFRFNCALPATYAIIYSSGQQSEREDALVRDVSAGGAKIFSDQNLQEGYLLNIGLQLGDDTVVAFGDVRSRVELPKSSRYAYQYGVRFSMMPESDQEAIVRYMYKLQREELKKARPR